MRGVLDGDDCVPGYLQGMDWTFDWTPIITGVVTAAAGYYGATKGGKITAESSKKVQINGMYVNELMELAKVQEMNVQLTNESRKDNRQFPPALMSMVGQCYKLSTITIVPDFTDKYAYLLRLLELIAADISNSIVSSGKFEISGSTRAMRKSFESEVLSLKREYYELIDTGHDWDKPASKGLFTPPPPPWPSDTEQTGGATHT